jgi:hypothetical protein
VSVELHIINAHAHGLSQLGESERPRSHLHNPNQVTRRPHGAGPLFSIKKALNKSRKDLRWFLSFPLSDNSGSHRIATPHNSVEISHLGLDPHLFPG